MALVATSAKSSGSSGSVTLLSSQTLGANAASITTGANGIAAGSSILEAWFVGRTTQATVLSGALITVNGDGSAIYDWQSVAADSTTVSGLASLAQTSWGQGALPGASATAGEVGVFLLTIPLYAGTTFRKQGTLLNTMNDQAGATNNFVIEAAVAYRSTTAINQLTVTASSGNLLAGSSLFVYGRT